MHAELIAVIANVALTLSFIVGLIFGIAQVRSAARDRKERLTLDTLRSFQTREFAELMNHITISEVPPTYEEWRKLGNETQIKFIQFSQQMESLGLMVAEGYIKMDLVDKTLGTLVSASWNKYQAVILDMRKKTSDPFLCEYFQWLAEKVEARMQARPRKPFHETR